MRKKSKKLPRSSPYVRHISFPLTPERLDLWKEAIDQIENSKELGPTGNLAVILKFFRDYYKHYSKYKRY